MPCFPCSTRTRVGTSMTTFASIATDPESTRRILTFRGLMSCTVSVVIITVCDLNYAIVLLHSFTSLLPLTSKPFEIDVM